jgi:hypothetical protein
MEAEDRLAALHVWPIDDHLPVEQPRTQERRVQHLRAIGGRHHDDPLAQIEAVHLG